MSKVNIQPLADRVLIEPAAADKTSSGIVIPDSAKENLKKERWSLWDLEPLKIQ